MIWKVKILGATLVAAMVVGAMAASVASAASHHFNSTTGDSITVEGLAPFKFFHTTGSKKNNGCKKVTMTGEVKEKTQTSLTLTPTFKECVTEEEGEPTGSMIFLVNGCDYRFTGVTAAGNPTGGEHANLHLECPEGKSIETRITALMIKCASIGPQEIKDAVRYENVTTEGKTSHVKAVITPHGVVSTTHPACGEGVHTNGVIETELTITTPHGISISTT